MPWAGLFVWYNVSMMTKIVVLGSSAAFPLPRTKTNQFDDYLDITGYQHKFELHNDPLCNLAKKGGKDRRTRSSLAIQTGTKLILFDCGPDIKYQLKKHKLVWPDAVFITHEHLDANYGLRYLPKSTQIFSEKLGNIKHGRPIELFGIKILPFRVVHSKIAPFSGYRVKVSGFSFVYVTDTASIRGVKKYVLGCDILFADGSILKRNLEGHLSIENQLKHYKKWRIKKVIFTHIGHATLPHEDLVKYVCAIYGNADVAYDGLVVHF